MSIIKIKFCQINKILEQTFECWEQQKVTEKSGYIRPIGNFRYISNANIMLFEKNFLQFYMLSSLTKDDG